MKLSIRTRLTLWYSSIVVIVLVTGAVVASFAQRELALQRLDDDLARSMATLEGVMRTEFGEGLTLEASAEEASVEVVVPDRALMLTREDGTPLEVWGVSLEQASLSLIDTSSATTTSATTTVPTPAGELRVLSRRVNHAGHRYMAFVVAPLATLRAQHAEMVRAMCLGVIIALIAAAGGGWLIGRQTLRPLTRMADEARQVNERDPKERLVVPPVNDELGHLAASFNGLLDRLASAMNFQRQFMADASHELRTPVSVVRTATQVTLSKDIRSVDEYRESLEIIGEQANRLTRLVDEMFLLSRAEAHGVPLRREFLNLDDVVAESARAVRVLAQPRGVLVVTGGAEEVGLTGDDSLLRQMVGNLLDNAVRHAQTDGRVIAELGHAADRVTLRITNDGPGIEAADRERIFERFVRIGASNGAGLGLPIARWIAEAHSGLLELESSRPGRTTFVVTLPLDPATDASSPVAGECTTAAALSDALHVEGGVLHLPASKPSVINGSSGRCNDLRVVARSRVQSLIVSLSAFAVCGPVAAQPAPDSPVPGPRTVLIEAAKDFVGLASPESLTVLGPGAIAAAAVHPADHNVNWQLTARRDRSRVLVQPIVTVGGAGLTVIW